MNHNKQDVRITKMKIAIASTENNVNADIATDFRECRYFIIADMCDLSSYEIILNPYQDQLGGADIFCAQMIISRGVEMLVTGVCTDDARRIFETAHIRVVTDQSGTVASWIEEAKNNIAIQNSDFRPVL